MAFISIYSNRWIALRLDAHIIGFSRPYYAEVITKLSTCLKVMRYFGEEIKKIAVCFPYYSERDRKKLKLYFNQYCAEALVELEYSESTLDDLTRTFTKVVTVEFENLLFESDADTINKRFPKLRAITLNRSKAITCLMGNFSSLERLDIHVFRAYNALATILQNSPQFKRLRIFLDHLDWKIMQSINKSSQLQSVHIGAMQISLSVALRSMLEVKWRLFIENNEMTLQRKIEAGITFYFYVFCINSKKKKSLFLEKISIIFTESCTNTPLYN